MKKTYIKPQAQAVSLFTEDTLLSLSSVEVNRDKETDEVFSEGKEQRQLVGCRRRLIEFFEENKNLVGK